MVKFENREIWADLENRSKVVHSENFPIWRPASGDRDHVTHHVTSHVTHWGQWKYASRSWHAVGNHRRQLKLMYRSKISGRGPKHCSGSKFQCRPRPDDSHVSTIPQRVWLGQGGWNLSPWENGTLIMLHDMVTKITYLTAIEMYETEIESYENYFWKD